MVLPDGSVPGPITIGVSYYGPPELETDNIPGTGDERPVLMESGQDPSTYVAALAKVARYVEGDNQRYIRAAERGVLWCVKHKIVTDDLFNGVLDLYAITRKPEYARLAKSLFPKVGLDDAESARQYDLLFHTNHRAEIAKRLIAQAEELVGAADNPFGVFTFGPKERPNFFRTPTSRFPGTAARTATFSGRRRRSRRRIGIVPIRAISPTSSISSTGFWATTPSASA